MTKSCLIPEVSTCAPLAASFPSYVTQIVAEVTRHNKEKLHFFQKNKLYKNTQAEICPKIKNKLRTIITRMKFWSCTQIEVRISRVIGCWKSDIWHFKQSRPRRQRERETCRENPKCSLRMTGGKLSGVPLAVPTWDELVSRCGRTWQDCKYTIELFSMFLWYF